MDTPIWSGTGIVSSYVVANGIRTHLLTAGDGEPLVLVHGAGPGASAGDAWLSVIPGLARSFRVVAIDTLGFGLTDKPTDRLYTDQASVEHLAAVIDTLALKTVSLCGNSRGAYIAARYMLDRPHRVNRLLMVSTATVATAMGLPWPADRLAGLRVLEACDGTAATMRRFMEVIIADKSKIDPLMAARVRIANMPGHDYVHKSQRDYRDMLRDDPNMQQLFDIRHRLPKVTKPLHLIWGALDSFAPPEFAAELRQLLPNAGFELFEASGHQTQTDEPERFVASAMRFFSA